MERVGRKSGITLGSALKGEGKEGRRAESTIGWLRRERSRSSKKKREERKPAVCWRARELRALPPRKMEFTWAARAIRGETTRFTPPAEIKATRRM